VTNIAACHPKHALKVQWRQALIPDYDISNGWNERFYVIKNLFYHRLFLFVPCASLAQIVRHVFAEQAHHMVAGCIDERVVHYAGYDGFDDRRIGRLAAFGAMESRIEVIGIFDHNDAGMMLGSLCAG
jgi:hypothetical protein